MALLSQLDRDRLLANGRQQQAVRGTNGEIDFVPVVKLFTPDANCTWLLTEIDPDHPDLAFGLCDLGLGFPELGSISLNELETARGPMGLAIECDRHFVAKDTLSEFANVARAERRIVS